MALPSPESHLVWRDPDGVKGNVDEQFRKTLIGKGATLNWT